MSEMLRFVRGSVAFQSIVHYRDCPPELDNKQNKACSAPAHHARLDAFKLREKDSAIWHIPEKQKRGI